jgi:tetratricopeptide (TPR) repeat protein
MTGDHPDPLLLERFMRNETDARERRAIIRHLLAGCPRCSVITSRLWGFGEERPVPADDAAVLDPSPYGQVFEDLARRLGDLQGSEVALAAGRALADEADPLACAGTLEMQARLLARQDRLDDLEKAETLLGRALALYRALGERHLEGRVLVLAAAVRSRSGGDGAAAETIRRLQQGLVRLDVDREPALAAAACHRLALLLAETGRGRDALTPLRRARALYERLEDGPNLARLRHLEGRVVQELDSPAEAEAAFQEGMRELLRAGLGAEAARALLDLALLYTRQGRAGDVQRLAEDFYPICRLRGVGLEVVTSLLFFRRLVETGHATPEVLFQVARFLADPPRAQRPALW